MGDQLSLFDEISANGHPIGRKYNGLTVTEQCESAYPETTAEFRRIQAEQYELFCKKQLNYGPGNISNGTDVRSASDIKLSLTGLWFRMSDKINRLKQLVILGNEDHVGESIEDTYSDLSVYGIICLIVSRKKWGK